MASTTQELIKKGFQISNKGMSTSFRQKIEMIASHYGSVNSFLKAMRSDFEKIVYVVDKPNFKLTANEYQKLLAFQKSGLIDSKLSVQQNFVNILTTQFISRQLEMIESLKLESLNVNPILASALNLNNETDLIRYYVYQAISRSIVTSVGFLVQDLLLYASETVVEGKDDELGEETKWDLVVEKLDEVKAFLEIKSSTNDLNKALINSEYILEILYKDDNFIGTDLFDILIFNEIILETFTTLINLILQRLSYKMELKSRILLLK